MNISKRNLVVAATAAALALLCLGLYVQGVRSEAATARQTALRSYGGEQAQVLVAQRDLLPGETLAPDNASMQTWVSDLLPKAALTDAAAGFGQNVSTLILANEPITQAKLGSEHAALNVPDGMVAMSIPVETVNAVGGQIRPGQLVNLHAIGETQVNLIADRIMILAASNAVGSESGTSAGELNWLSLAVRPELVDRLLGVVRDQRISITLPGQGVIEEEVKSGGATPGPLAAQ
ncbi:MAG: Flp pilus assembly protein CpaB [Coriobacteriales bacterium]|jgi:pilus assembly protein CpaB|nr:Flp pilus assembly protein CpaB [Coriobacteriales bacterium]